MATRPASLIAAIFLLVGAGLLANPLYLHSPPDRGSVLVSAERIAPADGAADISPNVTRPEALHPIARSAASQTLANGSFAVDRTGPPLALQLFANDWHYLGSQRRITIYRTTVTIGDTTSTLRLRNVSLDAAETALGLTPPGRLNETNHPKEIAWLAEQSPAVVVVGAFASSWEHRLDTAIDQGQVTVPNRNNASVFSPLGDQVIFLAHDHRFYRVTLTETNTTVRLTTTRVENQTALSAANVSVVAATALPGDVRPAVLDAIATDDGYTRVSHDATNTSRLQSLQEHLIRHNESYYVLRRGHVDDFDLIPLIRLLLTGWGVLVIGLAVGLEWRARRR